MKFDITITVYFYEGETEEIPEKVIDDLIRKAPRRYRNILLYSWADMKVEIKNHPI